ncbi:MAG: YibE/F family protein [Oscillospiraceae bacterium]
MNKNKDRILYVLLLVVSISLVVIGSAIARRDAKIFTGQTGLITTRYIVKVDEVLGKDEHEIQMGPNMTMTETKLKFSGIVLFGECKGEIVEAVQSYDTMTGRRPTPVQKGDWLFVYLTPETTTEYYAGEFVRLKVLLPVAIIFFILLIVFAKFKGLSSILALGLSVLSIFVVFIPAILSGKNIYLWAILICLYSIMITPFFIGGFNKKSIASALGCIGGVTVAGVLTAILNAVMKITGVVDEEAMMVSFILEEPIDLRAITFAAILIGALGATLDVSMSISSAMYETNEMHRGFDIKKLTNYGMNVGRDIIGTQISTLVLAYIGGSISVVLLLVAYQNSLMELLNLEIVIIELLQALIGGFTILFTIPATALVCGLMFTRHKQVKHSENKSSGS